MKVKDLQPAKYNPRKITDKKLEMLGKSMKEFGDLSGIVFNRKTKRLIGGHQRIKHLNPDWKIVMLNKTEGYINTPDGKWTYREVNWDEKKEIAANIAANKHGGEFDYILLKDLMTELDDGSRDMELTGFDMKELKEIFDYQGKQGLTEDDAVPDVPDKPKSKLGDLYLLGKHRVLCGDATKKEDVARLMNGKKADMVFTDPPYGIDYSGGRTQVVATKSYGKLQGDKDRDISRFIQTILDVAGNKDYYICLSPINIKNVLPLFDSYEGIIVWEKPQPGLGYQWIRRYCEFIVFGTKRKKAKSADSEFDFWEITTDPKNEYQHGTQKPVALASRAIQFSSVQDDVIVDFFLGSGSTLIACEKTGRICYGMEIDPHYCDVIVKRWEDFTGKKAVLK